MQLSWVELGSTPIHGDVDLFNVDLFGRAMLSDRATRVQHVLLDLGPTPMRAKVEKPLHNWAGQLPCLADLMWGGRPQCNQVNAKTPEILTRLSFG